jgi:hypothetical protein
MLSVEKMHSLYDYFTDIPDPRRAERQRHSLPTVLAISVMAVLYRMQGYKAILDWDKRLGLGAGAFSLPLRESKGAYCVAQKIRELVCNIGLVFDYLKMTKNSCA